MESTISIVVVSNSGDGSIDKMSVLKGRTSADILALKTTSPEKFVVAVNGDIASSPVVLNDGDRVTITPTKQAGA